MSNLLLCLIAIMSVYIPLTWEHQKEKVPNEVGRKRRLKHKLQQHTAKYILPSFRISLKQGARNASKFRKNILRYHTFQTARQMCSRRLEKHAAGGTKNHDKNQPKIISCWLFFTGATRATSGGISDVVWSVEELSRAASSCCGTEKIFVSHLLIARPENSRVTR